MGGFRMVDDKRRQQLLEAAAVLFEHGHDELSQVVEDAYVQLGLVDAPPPDL